MPRKKINWTYACRLDSAGASPSRQLRKAVQLCRGCDIWERATQAVLVKGQRALRVGCWSGAAGESRRYRGASFVGPAGKTTERGARAGRNRSQTRLYHQHRQTFQFDRAPENCGFTKSPMPTKSRPAVRGLEAEIERVGPKDDRLPWRDGCAGADLARFSRLAPAR